MRQTGQAPFSEEHHPVTRRLTYQDDPIAARLLQVGDAGYAGGEGPRPDEDKEASRTCNSLGPRQHEIPRGEKIATPIQAHIQHHVATSQTTSGCFSGL
jgi:hypothetical protein